MMNLPQPTYGGIPAAPRNIGLGESANVELRRQWDTLTDVETELLREGFTPMAKPLCGMPTVTEEMLTTPNSQAYTQMYAEQYSWFSYSSYLLALVTASLLQVRNRLDYVESLQRRQLRDESKLSKEKVNAADLDMLIKQHPEYKELKIEEQRFTQRKGMLSTYVESLESGMRIISRQVEIRKIDFEGTRNEANMPGRRPAIRTPKTP